MSLKHKFLNKSILMLMLALIAGLFAAWTAKQYISDRVQQIEDAAKTKTVPRLVAAYDLPVGTKIEEIHVAVRDFPAQWAPPSSLSPEKFIELEGLSVNSELKQGDLITLSYLTTGKNKPFSELLKRGRRAVTIPVDAINSVSGMLVAGDLIDLYVSFEYRRKKITAPLLQGVLVLATGNSANKDDDTHYSTVTLDASPEDAAKLVAARGAGSITALLRNASDIQTNNKGVRGDLATILGISTPAPTIKAKPVIIYGNNQIKNLKDISAAKENTVPKKDNKGLFELPDSDENIVSDWLSSLPTSPSNNHISIE